MCGISLIVGPGASASQLEAMTAAQHHRGPDARGVWQSPAGDAALGHNRLSIIDLSDAGRQPLSDAAGRWIVFNGEIYNYLELRRELSDYPFRTATDTEVLLAAYDRWGAACLDRLVGMFAFAIWDDRERRLFAARDRFGVKPLVFSHQPDGTLLAASEIKALHAAGVPAEHDPAAWAAFLASGVSDHGPRTFWQGISSLPPGHCLTWREGRLEVRRWYNLAEASGLAFDARSLADAQEEYLALLDDSLRLRFRSDVPVGINLSGGLDSSALLALVDRQFGQDNEVRVFTYVTGDERYDELPWVEQMLAGSRHPLHIARLRPEDVPDLAEAVTEHQDEPFGGLPTLAYAKVFEAAREQGVIVLLDGQGIDEQLAGYDYYRAAAGAAASLVQGTKQRTTRPESLTPEFRGLAEPFALPQPFPDALRNVQHRDATGTKIPKALRFNDRISMRVATELREPFLDHRLFELGLRQPVEHKLRGDTGKWLMRDLLKNLAPRAIVEAPKRPLQTPQREWLRGELRAWADGCIDAALDEHGGTWLNAEFVRAEWQTYQQGGSDNSFYVWQWISLGLQTRLHRRRARPVASCAPVLA